MKSFIKNSNLLFACMAIAIYIVSCSDMSELSDRFMDKGSTIYAPKVDSVNTHSGFKKIELDIFINAYKIDVVKISWNNGDSVKEKEILVNGNPGAYKVLIENLEEDSYVFNLISFDKYGNKSLPVEVTESAYGDNVSKQIKNRVITGANKDGSNLSVTWGVPVQNALYSILSYVNTADEETFVRVPMSETVTIVQDFQSSVKYSTFFLPTPTAIDTMGTEWKNQYTQSLLLPSRITFATSYIFPYGPVSAVYDGVLPKNSKDTSIPLWSNYPHRSITDWVELTMNSEIDLASFGIYFFNDNGGCQQPAGWNLDYWKDERWVTFPISVNDTYSRNWDKFNIVHPEGQILTNKLRFYVTSQSIASVGVLECQIFERLE